MAKSSESRITLEALIKLKRHEAPEADFWERFDRDLENRRLRALISGERSRGFHFGLHGWRSFGWISVLSGSAAAVVAFFALPQFSALSSGLAIDEPEASAPVALHAVAMDAEANPVILASDTPSSPRALSEMLASSQFESRFVNDTISADFEPRHFRRVLANPAFQGPRQVGAEFVADALMSNRPVTTFLVDRTVGQF